MVRKSFLLVIVSACLAFALSAFVPRSARADAASLATAKALIGKQVGQINAGDVEGLKGGFTDRLKASITADVVKKAAGQVKSMTIDDLVASADESGDSIKVKMKNGRTLTTLVKVGGAWKADTIWFK